MQKAARMPARLGFERRRLRPPSCFPAFGVRFENPAQDLPRRIEYRREDAALHAAVSGPGDDGEAVAIRYDYTACAD